MRNSYACLAPLLQTAPNCSMEQWIRVFFCSTPLHPPLGVEHGAKQIGQKWSLNRKNYVEQITDVEKGFGAKKDARNADSAKPVRIAHLAVNDPGRDAVHWPSGDGLD